MLINRLIACATTVAIGLGVVALQPASAASPSSGSPSSVSASARVGAGYLARQIEKNGGHLVSFGSPDVGNTAYAVLGLEAVGVGGNQIQSAIAFLKTQLDNLKTFDGKPDPGLIGYVVMAAVGSGQDPRHFGGTAPVNNLVARLRATVRTTGADAGLFGVSDPTYDGAFRQGVALAALAAAKVNTTLVAPSITWLEHQRCGTSGLWTSYRSDLTKPCPVANPNTFKGPDTNSTAMAVQGLAAFHEFPKASRTIASLQKLQTSDGGYPFLAAPGQSSDPDSTALVIQALLAEHVDPGTAVAALASFQLGCSDPGPTRGAYFFPGSREPNTFATVQAVPASALKTFPIAPTTASNRVPSLGCAASTSSATTSSATTSAATTSAATTSAATLAGTAGPCPGKTGVTVTVDFKAFGGVQRTRCATGPQASGIAALQHAGFTPAGTARYGLAFVCRINNLPTPAQQACVSTPPPTAFWAYYHALSGATTWTYASTGASSYKPPLGSIDAWAFGAKAKPTKTPAQVRAGQ